MNTKHTPEKWEIERFHNGFDIYSMGKKICSIWNALVGNDQAKANVKLIVAAPEMLEMLIKISNISNVAFTLKGFDVKRLKAEINNEIKKATR